MTKTQDLKHTLIAVLAIVSIVGIVVGFYLIDDAHTRFFSQKKDLVGKAAGKSVVDNSIGPSVANIPNRPNIVFIMTDDQDYRSFDVTYVDPRTNQTRYVMENVRNLLMNQGVTFPNSFASLTLCCPSRATFLTGQYAHNHGVWSNNAPSGGYGKLDHTNTLPVWLHEGGYITAHIGKYLNGYGVIVPATTTPPGWSEWYGLVDPSTYSFYDYTINENGKLLTYGTSSDDYQTDVLARKAQNFIFRHANVKQPFFLSVAFVPPHAEIKTDETDDILDQSFLHSPTPAPRHDGLLENLAPQWPASFNEIDMSDKPPMLRVLPKITAREENILARHWKKRMESLLAVDEAVAAIIDALERAQKLDDTFIMFMSDQGYFLGEHRIAAGKGLAYEEAIRAPLIIRGPYISAGTIIDALVANIDLAPTIADIAAVNPQRTVDGRSLMPLIVNPHGEWRKDFLIESLLPNFFGVRTKDYSYVEYSPVGKELYNFNNEPCHAADADQMKSQHENSCFQKTMDNLSRRLKQLKACKGKSCW